MPSDALNFGSLFQPQKRADVSLTLPHPKELRTLLKNASLLAREDALPRIAEVREMGFFSLEFLKRNFPTSADRVTEVDEVSINGKRQGILMRRKPSGLKSGFVVNFQYGAKGFKLSHQSALRDVRTAKIIMALEYGWGPRTITLKTANAFAFASSVAGARKAIVVGGSKNRPRTIFQNKEHTGDYFIARTRLFNSFLTDSTVKEAEEVYAKLLSSTREEQISLLKGLTSKRAQAERAAARVLAMMPPKKRGSEKRLALLRQKVLSGR